MLNRIVFYGFLIVIVTITILMYELSHDSKMKIKIFILDLIAKFRNSESVRNVSEKISGICHDVIGEICQKFEKNQKDE